MSASIDTTSLLQMAFGELLAPVQLLGRRGRISDALVESLRAYYYDVVTISGASLADSVHSYCCPDPLHPVLGNSRHGYQFLSFNK